MLDSGRFSSFAGRLFHLWVVDDDDVTSGRVEKMEPMRTMRWKMVWGGNIPGCLWSEFLHRKISEIILRDRN